MLKTLVKVALAPIYVPYKICEKIEKEIDSLKEPWYWPDHVPQNDPPPDNSSPDD